jgi:hypothetical protein
MISHTHDPHNPNSPIHKGSLADCPESTWTEIQLDDGRTARFYHGLSVTPPDTSKRLRFIDCAEIV